MINHYIFRIPNLEIKIVFIYSHILLFLICMKIKDENMKQITQEEKNEVHKHCKAIEEILNIELQKIKTNIRKRDSV